MELSTKNSQFQEWWESYDMACKSFGPKKFRHPLVGDMTLDLQMLQHPNNPDYCIIPLPTAPDSSSSTALETLSHLSVNDYRKTKVI